jgi:pilus assembly protein CpaE
VTESRKSVAILGARGDAPEIRKQLEGIATVVATQDDLAQAMSTLRTSGASVALVVLDHEPEAALALAKTAGALNGCAAIVVSRVRDPNRILSAMRSGARDFAFLDDESGDLKRALSELQRTEIVVPAEQSGRVISVFSAKGGSGATTIASNLAGSLVAAGDDDGKPLKVVLIDFNLEMGDVLVFLDVNARYSYQELLANAHRLDPELLYRSLTQHSSGVHVMSQTDYLEEGRELSSEDAAKVIAFLRKHFDFVIIDGLRDFRDISLVALDKSDTILLTMTQDIPALKNANRCLRIFKRLGYEGDRVQLVLNRFRRSGQLTPDSISDALGRRVAATVANDFPVAIKSANEGKVLVNAAPGSAIAKDIASLVTLFRTPSAPKRRSLFSLWGKG